MVHSRQRRWACQTVQTKASSPRSVMREGLCSNMTHTSEGCNMPMTSFETQRSPVRATRSSAQFRHCDGDSPREFADGIVPRLLANRLLHASGDGALRARVGHDQVRSCYPRRRIGRAKRLAASDAPCITTLSDLFPVAYRRAGWRDLRCTSRRSSESVWRRLPQ